MFIVNISKDDLVPKTKRKTKLRPLLWTAQVIHAPKQVGLKVLVPGGDAVIPHVSV